MGRFEPLLIRAIASRPTVRYHCVGPRAPKALRDQAASHASQFATQYCDYPRCSFQLPYENLLALAPRDSRLGLVPSYPTLSSALNT